MAIVQISKIQVRTGSESDLPQLDIGELGFTTDTKNAYIGNDPVMDPPVGIEPTLTQLLTNSPNCFINASQLTGVINVDTGNIRITGGVNGYVLQTDGTGNLSWSAMSSGGSGSPGGSNTQIQFNDAGSFGSTGNLVFDSDTNTLTLTGNLNAINIQGNIITGSQPNIISVGTLISLDVTGNITSGNATLGNLTISNYFSGNGSLLTSIVAVKAGTVTTNAQPNITSTGTLTTLTVSGVTDLGTAGNVKLRGGSPGQVLTTDDGTTLSWVTMSGGSGAVYGDANVKNYLNSGFFTTDFIGSIPTAVHATTADSANLVAGANVTGQVSSALVSGTVTTAAQPNVTSVGTLTSLDVTGNINSGNLITIGNVSGTYIIGNGSQLTAITGTRVTGKVANSIYADSAGSAGTSTLADVATSSVTAGTVTTAAQPNITSVGTIFKIIPVTFTELPIASDAGAGTRAFITDANTTTFGSLVSGSGSNNIPVFSNGTDWCVG